MDAPTPPPTFLDVEDTTDPDAVLPPVPITDTVAPPKTVTLDGDTARVAAVAHVFQHGTTPSPTWSDHWIALVADAEAAKGRAICGAHRNAAAMDEAGVDASQIAEDPSVVVCKHPAGFGTDHPGEGRCKDHGGQAHHGTLKTGRFALIGHHKLSPRVHEFFEMEELLDLRNAIAMIYAATDAMLETDDEITAARAQQIGSMMTRIGTLTKQHNEITAKKAISIGVPEFMAWAEYFYELAIKYIKEGDKDVHGFLSDAQQFYNATVTISIGGAGAGPRGDSAGALGTGGGE